MKKKKAGMTAKCIELKAIRDQKNKVIPGSTVEDKRLILEADAIRLDALNAVRLP